MNMIDFQQKAQLAAAKVQSLNPAEALAQSLTCDKPTINSAVKSFLSLIIARNLSSSDPNNIYDKSITDRLQNTVLDNNIGNDILQQEQAQDEKKRKCYFKKSKNPRQDALLCARLLLKTINNFEIPSINTNKEEEDTISEEDAMEIKVIIMLWNGLIKSGKNKPSMILGRKSLTHVYPLIINKLKATSVEGVDQDEVVSFMDEFGMLLDMAAERRCNAPIDDDSCLLWDIDGGIEELNRRKSRRMKNAELVVANNDASLQEKDQNKNHDDHDDMPRIEIISEGDEIEA